MDAPSRKRPGLLSLAAFAFALAVASSCALEDQVATLQDEGSAAYTGHIRISLAHPFDVKKDDYELLLSVPFDVKSMAVCHIKAGAVCGPGSPTFFPSELMYATPTRRFFRSEASALLEDQLVLEFVSYDANGKATDIRRIKFLKKGGSTPPDTGTGPSPTPSSTPTTPGSGGSGGQTGGAVTEEQARSVLASNCSGSSCHSFNPSDLKVNGSAGRIESGSMPKGRAIGAQDKNTLLRYIRGQ